jgi:hypothetical protein
MKMLIYFFSPDFVVVPPPTTLSPLFLSPSATGLPTTTSSHPPSSATLPLHPTSSAPTSQRKLNVPAIAGSIAAIITTAIAFTIALVCIRKRRSPMSEAVDLPIESLPRNSGGLFNDFGFTTTRHPTTNAWSSGELVSFYFTADTFS